MNNWEQQYLNLINKVQNQGTTLFNERTDKNCYYYLGDMLKVDMSDGVFPALTTKKLYVRQMIAELLGFIRGYDNAADFRELGCNFWNENANESQHWLENPNRKGEDDLGRVYGVQARNWVAPDGVKVDQLKNIVDKLKLGIDDRRLIVNHWNPGEIDQMALPPCHLMYILGIRDGHLDLCLTQRSCDVPLGVPMNIASYGLLLMLIAQITGYKPGVFTYFMWNIHIYEDQYELAIEQFNREPYDPPTMWINPQIKSLEDLETWVTTKDFRLENYTNHPAINYPFAK